MKKLKLYQDENILRHMYYDLKTPTKEIAEHFNISHASILYYFRKFNIKHDINIDKINIYGNRKYQCNYHYFDKINTQNKAYWLGFIMADGNIETRKDRTNSFRFILKLSKCDENHIVKLNNELSSNYPITYSTSCIKGRNKKYECSLIRISSSELCEGLMKNSVLPKKSCREVFPKNDIPIEYWKDFIRGVFDGDGCFSWFFKSDEFTPCCSFSLCGSEQMLIDCFTYISKCTGINIPKITKRPNNDLYTACIGGNFNVLKIMNWLYEDSSIKNRLDRKYEKYQEFLKEYNSPKYDEYKHKSNVYI